MRFLLASVFAIGVTASFSQESNDRKIWFNHPALDWNEALPIGNGRLGAMVFGGVEQDRLQLNEQTIWSGKPDDFVNPEAATALPQIRKLLFAGEYKAAEKLAQQKMMGDKKVASSYQMLGNLMIDFGKSDDVSNYRRELDLETAITSVEYASQGVNYRREIFASAPDQAIIYKLSATKGGKLSFDLSLERPGDFQQIKIDDDKIIIHHDVKPVGVKFASIVKVIQDGGSRTAKQNSLHVEQANAITIMITTATDFFGGDPDLLAVKQLEAVSSKTYDELKTRHIQDYQSFYKTCDLELNVPGDNAFPTDTRVLAFRQGNPDEKLLELYFQFGRYLLISSSRPGGLPANLQGLWADGLNPPWNADYHININIQMNYWPAEVTNLSALHEPFLSFLRELNVDGKKTARDMYGLPGSVAHFTSDAWHFTETYGHPQWAMWPMGLAWSSRHLWDHYLFTGDEKFLREHAYPVMKDAATFCTAFLVKDPRSKKLVSGPSISPENTFKTTGGEVSTMVMGPTMDHMIIRDLFLNVIQASTLLKADERFRKELEIKLKQLTPTSIGSDGRILEWSTAFEEPEPGHRHISHLYGLHPGNQITPHDTALISAARKTIDHRLSNGGGHTGWSKAWIINFYARLHDGDQSHAHLTSLLKKSTLPNLFDNHPPFQIDGNFGATAGIAEMLLQSHAGEIEILPALPQAWPTGSIHGICARGGFDFNIFWKDGKLDRLEIVSKLGQECRLRYGSRVLKLPTSRNQRYVLDGQLNTVAN